MFDSVRPHRWQPTRLRHPWGSPGKNTGVGCHFYLQCMKVKSESEVAQLCLTLSDLTDCSLLGSSSWIFQARVLEWVAIAFPKHTLVKYQLLLLPLVLVLVTTITVNTTTTICRSKLSLKFISSLDFSN